MVFDRPKKPGQSQPKPSPVNQKPTSDKPKKIITVGGGNGSGRGNSKGNGGGNGNNSNLPPPSPWLNPDNEPTPSATASFVEYLRWMREPESEYKDSTKVQILQIAEEGANYSTRLAQLTKRTELIAGKENTFQVKCSWRIRVGGHRGPESILLPAFDALGMPYVPSSTLRGAARTQAIREIMAQPGVKWKEAEKRVAPYFGSLDAENERDRSSKVVFLDAYPLPSKSGGLVVDMANNIWSWEGNSPKYSPNPNPFLSLKEPTFLIGLRLASGCDEPEILNQVKQWLIAGLQSGIGSQVNTGYGELLRAGVGKPASAFFCIEFSLKGQLIHGRQKFTQWKWNDKRNQWQMRGIPDAEVRPIAFKSMLRYWFRTLAVGLLEGVDRDRVKAWEANLFGAITPQQQGWIKFEIRNGRVTQREPRPNFQGKDDLCGEQEGILCLAYSTEAPEDKKEAISQLFRNLTWMMFHLGGIGQGARRPCYSRQSRERAPWYRGSTLYPDSENAFWRLPDTPQEFQQLFQQRLQQFYQAFFQLAGSQITPRSLPGIGQVSRDRWTEAVDANCHIVVCAGAEEFGKPYALAVLHSKDLKVKDRQGREDYDGNLCGQVVGDVKPSPVWIADLEDYQVVTVFGATQDPRKNYLQELQKRTSPQNYLQIYPLS